MLAGGTTTATARAFSREAKAGDEVFGIGSSPFLHAEFGTVRYTVAVEIIDDDTFSYDAHTWLQIEGRRELFDHRDRNTLSRVG